MVRYNIIENGNVVGYVDTDDDVAEYNGEDKGVEMTFEKLDDGLPVGPDGGLYGSTKVLSGDELVEGVRRIAELEICDFEVVKAS